jgi:hypothetical protein
MGNYVIEETADGKGCKVTFEYDVSGDQGTNEHRVTDHGTFRLDNRDDMCRMGALVRGTVYASPNTHKKMIRAYESFNMKPAK